MPPARVVGRQAGRLRYSSVHQTLLPLHFNFWRTTLKKETSGNAANGSVFYRLAVP